MTEGKVSHFVYHYCTSLTGNFFLRFELGDKQLTPPVSEPQFTAPIPRDYLSLFGSCEEKIFQSE